ncbi:hypothetical protein V6N12_051835 [Hibiscus sabdariffa]|uniref:Uncharacterized protein n=1 Tax=Hibiscus sabdariffa TaxID=183260 RepID=A0ABR2GGI0_9ROSI
MIPISDQTRYCYLAHCPNNFCLEEEKLSKEELGVEGLCLDIAGFSYWCYSQSECIIRGAILVVSDDSECNE